MFFLMISTTTLVIVVLKDQPMNLCLLKACTISLDPSQVVILICLRQIPPLNLRYMFSTKALLKQLIQVIAITNNFQYVTIKSNKEVLILQCIIEDCLWSLCASCSFHGGRTLWVLTRFDSEHTCSVDVPLIYHSKLLFLLLRT